MSSDLVPYSDIERMGGAMAKSGLFGLKTQDQAIALMLVAQAEGLHPATAANDYDVIQGRAAKKPVAMLRDFIKHGGAVKWHVLDDIQADATFSHPQGGTVRIAWDIPRAVRAGLAGKDNWKKYARQMLRSRCVSEGVRTVFPGATGGMLSPEELGDEPVVEQGMIDVTPLSLIDKIASAPSIEVLDRLAEEAKSLPDNEKDDMRKAYARRKAELKPGRPTALQAVIDQAITENPESTEADII